ncbi:hypothetical protein FN846DRAFT_889753 [Sphaerosporella brunnea]|uniref:Uncharacterized protein n=1 Tax=Sphaerosporella brunnea TaxID=1250544 RepID=A0A5J5EY67_9PEZI|nr:hypothetical protein FN846DRAFT_889753 [Sphaerosporella brunnea]
MDITYPTTSAPSRLAASAKPAMASSRQKDRQTQQLLEHDDVAAATVLQVDWLLDCIAAARTNAKYAPPHPPPFCFSRLTRLTRQTQLDSILLRVRAVRAGLRRPDRRPEPHSRRSDDLREAARPFPYHAVHPTVVGHDLDAARLRGVPSSGSLRRQPSLAEHHLRPPPDGRGFVRAGGTAAGCASAASAPGAALLLFCVPALRRLLRAGQPRSREMLRHLAALDAARDTVAVAALQRALLALFADCCDNVPDVLASVGCAYTFQTKTTVWCALHLGFDITDHPQIALKCDAAVHQTIADAERGSRTRSNGHCEECDHTATLIVRVDHTFNLRDGVLLVKPSPDHPLTVMDEQCGEWELCGGILGDGRAFFRQGDHFYRHEPQQRLPCAYITPLKDDSVERYCENQALHMLFYIRTGLHEGLENQAQAQACGRLCVLTQEPRSATDPEPPKQLEQQPVHEIEPLGERDMIEARLREVNVNLERDYLHCYVPQPAVLLPVSNCTGWYKSPQNVLPTPVSTQEHVLGDTRG